MLPAIFSDFINIFLSRIFIASTPDNYYCIAVSEYDQGLFYVIFQVRQIPAGDYSLGYAAFVVPLVNAVKEQQAGIEQQASEIAALKERLQRIEAMLTK
jgi:hypothetical protein